MCTFSPTYMETVTAIREKLRALRAAVDGAEDEALAVIIATLAQGNTDEEHEVVKVRREAGGRAHTGLCQQLSHGWRPLVDDASGSVGEPLHIWLNTMLLNMPPDHSHAQSNFPCLRPVPCPSPTESVCAAGGGGWAEPG